MRDLEDSGKRYYATVGSTIACPEDGEMHRTASETSQFKPAHIFLHAPNV
jgi:hypothetical protein